MTGLVLAANDNVSMGIIGIPVIHRDPIQARAEVALQLAHEFPSEALQILELGRILGSQDKPELMPVATAALRELSAIDRIARARVHPSGLPLASHAVAFDITQMVDAGSAAGARDSGDVRFDDDSPGFACDVQARKFRGRVTAT